MIGIRLETTWKTAWGVIEGKRGYPRVVKLQRLVVVLLQLVSDPHLEVNLHVRFELVLLVVVRILVLLLLRLLELFLEGVLLYLPERVDVEDAFRVVQVPLLGLALGFDDHVERVVVRELLVDFEEAHHVLFDLFHGRVGLALDRDPWV